MENRSLIWLGNIAVTGQSVVNGASYFLPLYITLQLHFSVLHVGTVLSMLGVGTLVGALSSSLICKVFSEYTTQIISFFGIAICLLAISFADNLLLLNIAAFFWGVFLFLFRPANQVWMLSLVPAERRVQMTNVRRMILNAGVGVGFIINGFLSHYNFKLVFYLLTAIALMLGSLMIYCFRYVGRVAHQQKVLSVKQSVPQQASAVYLMYISVFIVSVIYAQLRSNYPIYLHQVFYLDPRSFGLLFSLSTLLIVVLQIPIINWMSRYRQRTGIALGALFVGSGMVLMTLGNTIGYAIISVIIWTFGEILFFPLIQVAIFNAATERTRVLYMGFYQFIFASGIVLGPIGGSLIYHYFSAMLLWWICGLLGFVAMLICFTLRKNDL